MRGAPEGQPEGTAPSGNQRHQGTALNHLYLIFKATTSYPSEQACRLMSRSRGGYSGSAPANQHHDCSPGSCAAVGGNSRRPQQGLCGLLAAGHAFTKLTGGNLPSWTPQWLKRWAESSSKGPQAAPRRVPTVRLWERRGGNQNAARGAAGQRRRAACGVALRSLHQ